MRNQKPLLVYANVLLVYTVMNQPMVSIDWQNKTNLVRACFSWFIEPLTKKQSFAYKSVIVLTVIILMHYKKTILNCFVYIALAKK